MKLMIFTSLLTIFSYNTLAQSAENSKITDSNLNFENFYSPGNIINYNARPHISNFNSLKQEDRNDIYNLNFISSRTDSKNDNKEYQTIYPLYFDE